MATHLVCRFRAFAVAFLQHHVLQSGGSRDHALFLRVFFKEFLAVRFRLFAFGFLFLVHGCFFFLKILGHDALCLVVRYCQFFVFEYVLDGLCEIVDAKVLCSHAFELLSDTQA